VKIVTYNLEPYSKPTGKRQGFFNEKPPYEKDYQTGKST